MSKGVLYDATKCIGCRACQVACKQWNEKPGQSTQNTGSYENPPKTDAYSLTKIRFNELDYNDRFQWVFTKIQCMHCEHPACATACLVGAFQKTPEGAVVYDDNKCIGCRYCMVACPFGIPAYEWTDPTPWVRKCTFCADRQAAGLKPACVTTCPSGALQFGDKEDLIAEAHRRIDAEPGRYVDYIYGESEVGGTSWLYLSPVPFEMLGMPEVGTEAVTINVERAVGAVPPVLVGVAAVMSGVYWLVKRRQQTAETDAPEDKEQVEVPK